MALPVLAACAENHGPLTLVGRSTALKLLANQPFVSSIIDQESGWLSGLYNQPLSLNPKLNDLLSSHSGAAVFTQNPRDPLIDGLLASGIKPVITIPSRPPENLSLHLVDYMFASLNISPLKKEPRIQPDEKDKQAARNLINDWHLNNKPWVALSPGSGDKNKNWPIPNWVALAKSVREILGYDTVYILGPAEEGFKQALLANGEPDSTIMAQSLSLNTLAAVLSQARAYVGNDSGVSHLAAGLGIKSCAIFGPTNPKCWAPRGEHVRVISNRSDDTDRWSWPKLGQVESALRIILSA